jgi:glycosyltransferase involved in cell wall biosynthesis
MKRPLISVIITAYNRREFIRDAVNSIISSTLPEDEYEIIVVKNFKDENVDSIVEKTGGKSIIANLVTVGAMIALGINAARGDIVTFLDDDMYLPNRLSIIKRIFKSIHSLIYYHNNVITINETGSIIRDKLVESTNIYNSIIVYNYEDKLDVLKRYGLGLGLRSSSIAVKGSFIKRWVNIIKYFPELPDVIVFLLALIDEGAIIHDPRPLTYYRVSSTSTSSVRAIINPINRFNRAVRINARHALARHMLITLAEKLGLSKYIKYDEATIIGGIYGNWGRWLSRAIIDLVNCKSMTCIGSVIIGSAYLVNPWLAKRLIYLYYTRVFDVLWGLRS